MTEGLPVMSGAKLIRALERVGWQQARQRGSHVRLKHRGRSQFLVVPLHRELKRGTLNGTLRDAAIGRDVALWALGDPARLTEAERATLVDPAVERCLSPISVWEAAIKREAGRLRAPRNLTAMLAAEFRMLEVTASLLEAAARLPRHHGDPFDRVLIAHALEDDMSVLTRVRAFDAYGVRLAGV